MHQALYRKWRSKTFAEIVGQSAITAVLCRQVAEGKTSHAYLFCGSRGTGKTSCAKILAKAVNCENPIDGNPCGECASCRVVDSGNATDILELDAASNNGVDTVRDIRDEVVYSPSELRSRVYIIDEVHMLSSGAFNALLKTLEEPPSGVVFILATTEPQKLPATIVSRCQRFDFRRIPSALIADHLMKISEAEGFEIERDAAELIASLASGGMRDAISMLELCSGRGGVITRETVTEATGYAGRDILESTFSAMIDKDLTKLFSIVASIYESSGDLAVYWQELLGFARDMLVCKTIAQPGDYLDLTEREEESLRAISAKITADGLISIIGVIEEAYYAIWRGNSPKRLLAELALTRIVRPAPTAATEGTVSASLPSDIAQKIDHLEGRVNAMALYVKKNGLASAQSASAASASAASTAASAAPNVSPAAPAPKSEDSPPWDDDAPPPWDDNDAPPDDIGDGVPREKSAPSMSVETKSGTSRLEPAPSASSQAAKNAADTAASPAASGTATPRPAGFWKEVVADYEKEDRGLAPLLRMCSAEFDGVDALVLRADNPFAAMRLGEEDVKRKLAELAAVYAPIKKVVIEKASAAPKKTDALDEL